LFAFSIYGSYKISWVIQGKVRKRIFIEFLSMKTKTDLLVNPGLCCPITNLHVPHSPYKNLSPRKLTTNFLVQKISGLLLQHSLHIRHSYN